MADPLLSLSLTPPNPNPRNSNKPAILSHPTLSPLLKNSTFRRDLMLRSTSLCFVSLLLQNPFAIAESLADSSSPPKSGLSGIANTKSWFQFLGDGFAIRIPPQFQDITEPEDYTAGMSLYGDKAKPKTFAARFASPDGSEIVSVVIRPTNQLKITFLEAKDISDLGSLKDAARIFVPGGATVYTARTIKIKEDEGFRNYYFYEFGRDEQRVALVAAVNDGKAFIAGATAPESKWPGDGVKLRFGSSRSYHYCLSHVPEGYGQSVSSCFHKTHNTLSCICGSTHMLRSTMAAEFLLFVNDKRSVTAEAKAPAQLRRTGAVKVSMLSPGFVYEPYVLRERLSFWRRWFTRSGWKRTKEDFVRELKSAYAIAKLRRAGHSKDLLYREAAELYKEINTLMANGDKKTIRKNVTERMYSALKNEIKVREDMWSSVHWEMIEPIVKMRTLQARLIGVDPKDLKKVFIQLTIEFLTKQKFEAYDLKGNIVAGDRNKEVLVRDVWVFERSLFHSGAHWRLCGRLKV